MNQLYYLPGKALNLFRKRQASPTAQVRNGLSGFTALVAVLLVSCFWASGAVAQTTYYSKAAATDFNDVASWGTANNGSGDAPAAISNANNFIVANGAALSLSGNAAVRQLTVTSGSLTVAGNTLSIGIAAQKKSFLLINGGTFTVSGGTVNIDGYLSHTSGNFNQSGGSIVIDPNNGGDVATSTLATEYTLNLRSSTAPNWTGGSITLLDPPATTGASHYSVYYSNTVQAEVPAAHTIKFGDGVSADAGGNAIGFLVYNWISSGKINWGSGEIYGPSANNRKVKFQDYSNGFKGTFTIHTNGELDQNAIGLILSGDVNIEAGATWTASGNVTFALAQSTSSVVNPNAQSVFINSNAVVRNAAATPVANFTTLTFNNSNVNGITFNGSTGNITAQPASSISANTITFNAGRIATNGPAFVLGNATPSAGTLNYTTGGFKSGTVFGRWFTATGQGTAFTSGVDAANATSRYPFIDANGSNRPAYIERVSPVGAPGVLAVTYNNTPGRTAVNLTDATVAPDYIIDTKGNDTWAVSALAGTPLAAASFKLQLQAPNMFGGALKAANTRIIQGTSLVGTHQPGTITPGGQRIGLTGAQLTAAPFSLAVNEVDIPNSVIASGNWNSPSTWSKGVAPTCTEDITIGSGFTVTVNSAGNTVKSLNIAANASLVVASGDLTVGCTLNNNQLVNNGTLTVSGGTLNVNGNINNATVASSFSQSGGTIVVDGNNGVVAESVASGTALFNSLSTAISLTGGTLLFVDPHIGTTNSSAYTILLNNATPSLASLAASPLHTTQFGDGVSTTAGGNTSGFYINNWSGSAYLSLGSVVVNGATGTNRNVTSLYQVAANGNVTVNANSTFTVNSLILGGNLTVNGTFVNTTSVVAAVVASNTGGELTYGPAVNAQTFTNNGTLSNLAALPTANFAILQVNNTSAAGVTLASNFRVSGTLALVAGKVNTTTANLLTVGTATAAGAITGGSNTAFVRGPLARTINANNAATNFIHFPVGTTVYAPIWAAPATTSVASMKAEAFDSNGGSMDASIVNLATNRRWELPLVSGTATSINVSIGDSNLDNANVVVMAPSAAGQYSGVFGSVNTFTAATATVPNIITGVAAPAVGYTGFIGYADSNACTGTPAPGNTIASSVALCAGSSVSLSVENATTGSGVSYQWQSSADGTSNWTNITDATNATYTTTPVAELYYRLNVTCATGASTGSSTAVLVAFTNKITATTPDSRCGTGPVTLQATANAGANIVWYDASTGGNIVGNTGSLEIPSLAETKTYYAAAQSATSGAAVLGTGTLTTAGNGITPFNSNYEGARIQYLVKASELKASGLVAGNLTSLAFDVSAIGGAFVQSGYTVKIAATSVEALSAFATGTFTTVYGPVGQGQTVPGWNTLTFSTPFAWDGDSNIVIEICHDNDTTNTCTNCYATNSTVRYTATTYNSVFGRYVDNAAACGSTTAGTASTSANRPNMRFAGQVGCNSVRVPVIATVTTAPALTLSTSTVTICEGESSAAVTITSVPPPPPPSASSTAAYDTFVWTPSTGVTGSALTGWVFNPEVTTTYTLNAVESTGNECAATATVTVTVNPLPTDISIADIDDTVCVNNVVALTATGGKLGGAATIGAATTLTGDIEQPTAFMNRWASYTMQTVYTAAELNAAGLYAGNISSMAFNVATLGSAATNTNYTVRIGTTTAGNFATGTTAFVPVTGFATVYGPQTYTHTATGWQEIPFSAPYAWDGTSNLIVSITMGGANSSNNTQTYFTETTDNTVLWAYNTNAAAVSKKRLNVKFTSSDSSTVTWSPVTNLYTDNTATTAYVAGTNAAVVYVKPAAAGNTVYTATAETNNTCTVDATVVVNAADCSIGWGNVQWPANGEITTCGSHEVYAQVWKQGITEAAGQGVGIQAWIGINTSNTDPATWAESDWHLATFNVQVFDNDEFKYTITGLPAGTYYYASRFQYLTGSYLYGGFQGIWGGGNVNGVLTVNAVTAPAAAAAQQFCNSATVADLATTSGTGIKWYADATGGTALDGTTALVSGETYFASQTVNSCEGTARTEVTVTITTLSLSPIDDVTACDSYTLPVLITGNYFTAANGGGTALNEGDVLTTSQTVYVYATAGTLPCTAQVDFDVTINSVTVADPADVNICGSYTLPVLTTGNYFTATGGTGTALFAGDDITSSQTIYVYATAGTCSDEESFEVNVTAAPAVDELADASVCDSYTLPVLTVGQYYTGAGGTGTQLNAGDLITSSQTIYIYAESAPACSDESSFAVTVNSISVTAPADVTACNNYTLPVLTAGNYFTQPNGGGDQLDAGDVITASQTIYVYASVLTCTDEDSFEVNITTVAQPTTSQPTQTITGVAGDVTIEDIVVNETGVVWFATEEHALAGTPALAAGTELVSGTYYGVLFNGTCYSTPLAINMTVILGNRDFDMGAFSYYPNPVRSVLNIAYSSDITSVEVYNMLGQQVISKKVNAAETAIDMSALAEGTYVLNVTAGNVSKTIKIVKKQ